MFKFLLGLSFFSFKFTKKLIYIHPICIFEEDEINDTKENLEKNILIYVYMKFLQNSRDFSSKEAINNENKEALNQIVTQVLFGFVNKELLVEKQLIFKRIKIIVSSKKNMGFIPDLKNNEIKIIGKKNPIYEKIMKFGKIKKNGKYYYLIDDNFSEYIAKTIYSLEIIKINNSEKQNFLKLESKIENKNNFGINKMKEELDKSGINYKSSKIEMDSGEISGKQNKFLDSIEIGAYRVIETEEFFQLVFLCEKKQKIFSKKIIDEIIQNFKVLFNESILNSMKLIKVKNEEEIKKFINDNFGKG